MIANRQLAIGNRKFNMSGSESEGKYIYCIIDSSEERGLGIEGIGSGSAEVHTVALSGIAAVVSDSPVEKYEITRDNTLAHQRVMEKLIAEGHTALPVRFDTIAESKDGASASERIRQKVLLPRHDEFEDIIAKMRDKVELGLKALWKDMDVIFGEIVRENADIRGLRNSLQGKSLARSQQERILLGKMVKSALDAKREKEEAEMLGPLERLAVDFKRNKIFGDRMVTNAAFLVEADERERQFDEAVGRLASRYGDRFVVKYVGPVPICNFVELVITWDD